MIPNAVPNNTPADQAAEPRRTWPAIRIRLIEGLLFVLPILFTFWMIHWLYSGLEKYVIDPIAVLVIWKAQTIQGEPELPYWFENIAAPVISIVLVVFIVYLCGVLAHSQIRISLDRLLLKVPVVAQIYDAARGVVKCFDNKPDRKPVAYRMVLVPFPHTGMRLPAIVTSACTDVVTGKKLLCVYVPTTPVPASGFFLMLPEEEATELNWDVQETMQAIISGGLTAPAQVTYFKGESPPQFGSRLQVGAPIVPGEDGRV